jgi:urease alpha subunit
MTRKLTLALCFLFGLWPWAAQAENTVGPSNQVLCTQLVFQSASTASLATLLAGAPGKIIFICGWQVTSSNAAASTFQLSSGTGTNCGTTNTNITPPYNVTSTAPATDHVSIASISLPVGNNLCVISSGTSLQIGIWVGQY